MLNKIWPIMIIISCAYGILTGKVENVNNSIFESASSAVQLSITFLGTICLWNGIMKIAQTTTLIEKLTNVLKPFINFLFPEMQNNDIAKKEISMNVVANILGLGNAATPLGLKAMKTMQKSNKQKDTVNNSMAMFIIINTASLQLIPTTAITIRASLGSSNPSQIIVPVWIATIVAAIAGITAAKIFIKKSNLKSKDLQKYNKKRKEKNEYN